MKERELFLCLAIACMPQCGAATPWNVEHKQEERYAVMTYAAALKAHAEVALENAETVAKANAGSDAAERVADVCAPAGGAAATLATADSVKNTAAQAARASVLYNAAGSLAEQNAPAAYTAASMATVETL